ncbi:MAG: 1-(5-phosphoribosyl)-5-((5-phosphoribosylamino)methylideneamino)imidazole-4-carboxamide isomerase [Pyrobaculum sp.]|jgi:phosphoribosylformimino-5-aminoimidazole carboxamide ribotide isomerase|nr:1-(5-phosphoribosyl)-5-((5-phosphoribosylamino)methylideneamino)imidazole-4-carboxamide isomerase [Pyrobaculum sp.]
MIIPSIDIEGGRAVKRVMGRRGQYVFVGDPLALAERFKKAPLVHVVDLDGAEAGRPVNVAVVENVVEVLGGRCQLGGGIRSEEALRWALSICRVAVVGTMPFKQPELFQMLAAKYGDRLAASLDVRQGRVAVEGWREAAASVEEALNILRRFGKLAAVIVTAVDVEGTGVGFVGFDVAPLRDVAERIYYAGGIKSCHDVQTALNAGFDGVIVGYALYRGDLRNCADF